MRKLKEGRLDNIEAGNSADRLRIERSIETLGTDLLNLQIWCWGQDVKRPQGNVLMEYGFTRTRPPEGERGSSTYSLSVAPGRIIKLWGFGLFYGDADLGGLILKRFEFKPNLTDAANVPHPVWLGEHLPKMRLPQTAEECREAQTLLVHFLDWVCSYERWVAENIGLEYRKQCVGRWKHTDIKAERVAALWDELASAVLTKLVISAK